jgi:ribonuclease P protein component
MLPKENRIKKKKDFEAIYKKGKSFKNSFFILKVLNNNLKISRFAFVISQKVSKKAVERNKIRRIMSSFLEVNFKNIKIGFDFVFIVLPNAQNKNFDQIKKAISDIIFSKKFLNI